MFRKMLVEFMGAKRRRLERLLGRQYGELYFAKGDEEDLMALDEGLAQDVWNEIEYMVNRGARGLHAGTCPFCLLTLLKSATCLECSYASRHGICSTMKTDLVRINERVSQVGLSWESIWSNRWYRMTVTKIRRRTVTKIIRRWKECSGRC